jgi:hypothetical protein
MLPRSLSVGTTTVSSQAALSAAGFGASDGGFLVVAELLVDRVDLIARASDQRPRVPTFAMSISPPHAGWDPGTRKPAGVAKSRSFAGDERRRAKEVLPGSEILSPSLSGAEPAATSKRPRHRHPRPGAATARAGSRGCILRQTQEQPLLDREAHDCPRLTRSSLRGEERRRGSNSLSAAVMQAGLWDYAGDEGFRLPVQCRGQALGSAMVKHRRELRA